MFKNNLYFKRKFMQSQGDLRSIKHLQKYYFIIVSPCLIPQLEQLRDFINHYYAKKMLICYLNGCLIS